MTRIRHRSTSAGSRARHAGRALTIVGITALMSYGISLQVASAGGRGYSHRVERNDPVSYWRLNETRGTVAHDAMGNYNATYVRAPRLGAPGLMDTPSGHSVWLDGTNDRVTADSLTHWTSWPGYTLEAWVRIDQDVNEEHIIAFNDYAGGNGLALLHDQPTGRFKFRDCEGTGCVKVLSTTVPQVGNRYYVVVTVNRQNQGRLFINGEREAIFHSDKRPLTNALLTIGGEYDGDSGTAIPTSFFHGNIDEVAIYNHALRHMKIRAHYRAGLWARRG
ncbi:MAG: LamG domain-containing protein [Actinomycetota bacterium]|nr:LamG domain-containing protein [Actinomycetota bacterium]